MNCKSKSIFLIFILIVLVIFTTFGSVGSSAEVNDIAVEYDFETMNVHVSDGVDVILYGILYNEYGESFNTEVEFEYREVGGDWNTVGYESIDVSSNDSYYRHYHLLEFLDDNTKFEYRFLVDGEYNNVVEFETDEKRLGSTPNEIRDWSELYNIRYDLNADYELVNDLDENTSGYNIYVEGNDYGWLPIGYDDDFGFSNQYPFMGNFYGNGNTISDIWVNTYSMFDNVIESEHYKASLFVETEDAYILGLEIDGGSMRGGLHTASMTSVSDGDCVFRDIVISNFSIGSSYVYGDYYDNGASGFVSRLRGNGAFYNIYVDDSVVVEGSSSMGGLVSYIDVDMGNSIEDVYVGADVIGGSGCYIIGGLIGHISEGDFLVEVSNLIFTGDLNWSEDSSEVEFGTFLGSWGSSEDNEYDLSDVVTVDADEPFIGDDWKDGDLGMYGKYGQFNDEELMSYDFYNLDEWNTEFDIARYDDHFGETWYIHDGDSFPIIYIGYGFDLTEFYIEPSEADSNDTIEVFVSLDFKEHYDDKILDVDFDGDYIGSFEFSDVYGEVNDSFEYQIGYLEDGTYDFEIYYGMDVLNNAELIVDNEYEEDDEEDDEYVIVIDEYDDVRITIDFGNSSELYNLVNFSVDGGNGFGILSGSWLFGERTTTTLDFEDSEDYVNGTFDVSMEFGDDFDVVGFDSIGSWRNDIMITSEFGDDIEIIDEPFDGDVVEFSESDSENYSFSVEIDNVSEFDKIEIYTNPSVIDYILNWFSSVEIFVVAKDFRLLTF